MTQTCRTCAHGLPTKISGWSGAADYRHCQLAGLKGLPVPAWFIGAGCACSHNPSQWREGAETGLEGATSVAAP